MVFRAIPIQGKDEKHRDVPELLAANDGEPSSGAAYQDSPDWKCRTTDKRLQQTGWDGVENLSHTLAVGLLWSAIIEPSRRKWMSSQTAHMACRAKHHWTTTLLAATIARHDSSVLGGCPAYAECTALAPSLRAVGMDTTGTS